MKACKCGNTKFYAKQRVVQDVVVDILNNWIKNISVSSSEEPFGNYYCTKCNSEYLSLDDLPDIPNSITFIQKES